MQDGGPRTAHGGKEATPGTSTSGSGGDGNLRLTRAPDWQPGKWLGVLVFGLTLAVFLPAIRNDFVGFDDPEYVTGNAQVQRGLTWETVRWALGSSKAANWHPLTWMSHMLDCQLYGLAPWGHHLTAVLLHAVSTLLVFIVLREMTGARWRSLLVALLFGLHPLRVESVVWIAERKDVLSTLFWMLTLWAYGRAWTVRPSGAPQVEGEFAGRGRWLALSLGFFCLGLLAKPMVVTLPFALLLLDYWPLRRWPARSAWRLVGEKVPFFVAAGVVSVVTFLVQSHAGAMSAALPLTARIANAVVSYCRYLGKLFRPVDLAFFYPPPSAWPLATVLLASLVLVALTVAAVALHRRHPYLAVGWFWYVGILVPVIGLVQVGEQAMADRYSYIPSLGILIAVVWGVSELVQDRRERVWLAWAAGTGAVLGCVLLTQTQIVRWKGSESLFRHALEVTEHNHIAHNNLGTTLDKQGRLDEALSHLEAAARERPANPEVHNNLGVVLDHLGRLDEAVKEYLTALNLRSNYAEAHLNLGTTLEKQGQMENALRLYQKAVRLKPGSADAHYNLGLALARQGHLDAAIEEFRQTVRLQPNSPDAHNNLALTLLKQGRPDAAVAEYRLAIQLKPGYARAHFNLGVALSSLGQVDEAIAEFRRALEINPNYGEAKTNLEALLDAKRQPGQAGLERR